MWGSGGDDEEGDGTGEGEGLLPFFFLRAFTGCGIAKIRMKMHAKENLVSADISDVRECHLWDDKLRECVHQKYVNSERESSQMV